MDSKELWNNFVKSGKIEDYIKYKNSKKGDDFAEHNDRCACDKGNEYKG